MENLFLPLHLSGTPKVHNHYSLIDNDGDCLSKYETSNTQFVEGADSKDGFAHKILDATS